MRDSLLKTFTDIYILDLHGSSKKRQPAPDGKLDQNVFDIQQGVAIGIFVKRDGETGPARVHHSDLWGTRESKYAFLSREDLRTTKWTELEPSSPFYLFCPLDESLALEYAKGWKITDAMPVHVLGFQTHRDDFAISFSQEAMRVRMRDMRDAEISDGILAGRYGLAENRDWKLTEARRLARADDDVERQIVACQYRPFDARYCHFGASTMDFPRRELLDHVAGRSNLCLLTSRQTSTLAWKHAFISDKVAESCVVSNKTKRTIVSPYTSTSPRVWNMRGATQLGSHSFKFERPRLQGPSIPE